MSDKKVFCPQDWAISDVKEKDALCANESSDMNGDEFELLLAAIEASGKDLTSDYNDWYKIGIAIASEFGESGRDYFHRIGKFISIHYNFTICISCSSTNCLN